MSPVTAHDISLKEEFECYLQIRVTPETIVTALLISDGCSALSSNYQTLSKR